jgi:hypothetical protein
VFESSEAYTPPEFLPCAILPRRIILPVPKFMTSKRLVCDACEKSTIINVPFLGILPNLYRNAEIETALALLLTEGDSRNHPIAATVNTISKNKRMMTLRFIFESSAECFDGQARPPRLGA